MSRWRWSPSALFRRRAPDTAVIGRVDPSLPFVILPASYEVTTLPGYDRAVAGIARAVETFVLEQERAKVRARLEVMLADLGMAWEPWQMNILVRHLVPRVDTSGQHGYVGQCQTDTDPRRT